MSWKPLSKLSEIMAAEKAGLPIIVREAGPVVDGKPSDVELRAGGRYRIATELINVLCTVVGINHGAKYPLRVLYKNDYGDSLEQQFSPDELLWVRAL